MSDNFSHFSLFGEPWWLDAASGAGGWDEVVVSSGGLVDARLPFKLLKARGLRYITMPAFTQKLGPWFSIAAGRESAVFARQKDLAAELMAKLPKHDVFGQSFHAEISNWLPWYWQGYSQSTRYSYCLSDLSDLDRIWSTLQSNIRGDIRKATKRFGLEIREDPELTALLRLLQLSDQRRGVSATNEDALKRIVASSLARKCGKLLYATDVKGAIHAGLFIVWDERCAYYLVAAADPDLRKSGAQSFLLWEAIKFSSTVTASFDFEGSMVESIERFFRAFGGEAKPYSRITKINNKLVSAAQHFRDGAASLFGPRLS